MPKTAIPADEKYKCVVEIPSDAAQGDLRTLLERADFEFAVMRQHVLMTLPLWQNGREAEYREASFAEHEAGRVIPDPMDYYDDPEETRAIVEAVLYRKPARH